MTADQFFNSDLFTWGILPALIFFARIADMSLDTMRIIMVNHGQRHKAAVLGFFEVSIWLLVARQVITHLPNPLCFFAYAGGFAAGNYVGIMIEEKFASGVQMIRVIADRDGARVMAALAEKGYGVTSMTGQGAKGPVSMVITIVDRRHARNVISLVQRVDPDVFYTIEDVRSVSEGIFPPRQERSLLSFLKRK